MFDSSNTYREYFLNTSQAVIFYESNKLHWYTRRYHWYADKHDVLFDELFSICDGTNRINSNCLFSKINDRFELNCDMILRKYVFEYIGTSREMYGVVMDVDEYKAEAFASLIKLLY